MKIIYVDIGNGVIVPHTPEEWARFLRGVDVEAAWQMVAELKP